MRFAADREVEVNGEILAVDEAHEAVERQRFFDRLSLPHRLVEQERLLPQPRGVPGHRLGRHPETGCKLAIARAAHEASGDLEKEVGPLEPVSRTERPIAERPSAWLTLVTLR